MANRKTLGTLEEKQTIVLTIDNLRGVDGKCSTETQDVC